MSRILYIWRKEEILEFHQFVFLRLCDFGLLKRLNILI